MISRTNQYILNQSGHWALLWDLKGNRLWQRAQRESVMPWNSPQLGRPINEIFPGMPFKLFSIFLLTFAFWHSNLFAVLCMLAWHTEPQNNCEVHIGKRRRGSTRSCLLPWGNLQVSLQRVKQRGSGKGVKKPEKLELLTNCIVDMGHEAYKPSSLNSMLCQDVMRWMGPTKCYMCLSQEAILHCFPAAGDCFMDVTCQIDLSIKWELEKGKDERKGLVNFCLSPPCTWTKHGVWNDLKDPSSVMGHVLT